MLGRPVSSSIFVIGSLLALGAIIFLAAVLTPILFEQMSSRDAQAKDSQPENSRASHGEPANPSHHNAKSGPRTPVARTTQEETEKLLNDTILAEVDIEKLDLAAALDYLQELIHATGLSTSQLRLTADKELTDRNLAVTELRLRQVPVDTALAYLCDHLGCRYRVGKGVVELQQGAAGYLERARREALGPNAHKRIQKHLNQIVIPSIDFEDVTMADAIDYLRIRSRELDPEPDPSKRGIGFIIRKPAIEGDDSLEPDAELDAAGALIADSGEGEILITYQARNVSLWEALEEIVSRAGMEIAEGEVPITIVPRHASPPSGASPEESELDHEDDYPGSKRTNPVSK